MASTIRPAAARDEAARASRAPCCPQRAGGRTHEWTIARARSRCGSAALRRLGDGARDNLGAQCRPLLGYSYAKSMTYID